MSTAEQKRIVELEHRVAELESDPHQVAQKQMRELRAREQADREKQHAATEADYARARKEIEGFGPSLDREGKLHAFVDGVRVPVGVGGSLPCPACGAPFAQGAVQSLCEVWRGSGGNLGALIVPSGRPWYNGIPAFYSGEKCSSCGNSSTVFIQLCPLG